MFKARLKEEREVQVSMDRKIFTRRAYSRRLGSNSGRDRGHEDDGSGPSVRSLDVSRLRPEGTEASGLLDTPGKEGDTEDGHDDDLGEEEISKLGDVDPEKRELEKVELREEG